MRILRPALTFAAGIITGAVALWWLLGLVDDDDIGEFDEAHLTLLGRNALVVVR